MFRNVEYGLGQLLAKGYTVHIEVFKLWQLSQKKLRRRATPLMVVICGPCFLEDG